MISYIHGILSDIEEGSIVVEAGGVGYGIHIPSSVLPGLPPAGSELRIYTYYSVREDAQTLYGFLTREDREMFRSLISVNGVGPKGALSILSVLGPDDLRMAIVSGDAKSISRAQGIGIKTAERVILDLRDRVQSPEFAGGAQALKQAYSYGTRGTHDMGPAAEAMEALAALGYSRSEAARAVSGVRLEDGMTTEEVLKQALKTIKL